MAKEYFTIYCVVNGMDDVQTKKFSNLDEAKKFYGIIYEAMREGDGIIDFDDYVAVAAKYIVRIELTGVTYR